MLLLETFTVAAALALEILVHSRPSSRLAGYLLCHVQAPPAAIVKVVPTWVSEEIPSASDHIGDRRTVLWMREN